MIKRYVNVVVFLAAAWAAVIGFVSCDKDCPVCPPAVTVSDYDIYVSGTYARAAYVYNTVSRTITDTIPLSGSYYTTDIGVSGDGRYLLVLSTPGVDYNLTNLAIIDAVTMDTVRIMTGVFVNYLGGGIEVSNTGKYIAVYDQNSIHFLDGATFEVLFSDTLDVHSGRFSSNDSLFYCEWLKHEYGVYDMAAESLVTQHAYSDTYGGSAGVWGVQPTHDGATLYMFIQYHQYANYIISYRPAFDSVGMRWFIGPPGGDLRLSPDGKIVLASDPGSVNLEILGSEMIIAVDVATEGITRISPGYCVTDSGLWYLVAGDIAFTPDSKYAAVGDARFAGFGLLDLSTLRYADVKYRPIAGGEFNLVACRKTKK